MRGNIAIRCSRENSSESKKKKRRTPKADSNLVSHRSSRYGAAFAVKGEERVYDENTTGELRSASVFHVVPCGERALATKRVVASFMVSVRRKTRRTNATAADRHTRRRGRRPSKDARIVTTSLRGRARFIFFRTPPPPKGKRKCLLPFAASDRFAPTSEGPAARSPRERVNAAAATAPSGRESGGGEAPSLYRVTYASPRRPDDQ